MGETIKTIEISVGEEYIQYNSPILRLIEEMGSYKADLDDSINESIKTIEKLTPNCDKTDYALAASSGVLCGLIDIFFVGAPKKSLIGTITDEWYKDKVLKFAKLNGCSSLAELEAKYIVPYDQTTPGQAFKEVFDLTPRNHHFKSLAHNPSLFGLFFSILDQFSSPSLSHFISNGEMITLIDSSGGFALRGNNVISKFYCAFANWIGHLISDVSGSSGSKGRGMGLPSPLWTWSNDIIATKRMLYISPSEFDKRINELALEIYDKGYDLRFQTAQTIPIIINEFVTRLLYSVRRLIKYFTTTNRNDFALKNVWKECEPFNNASVKRMLTVSHGTFCLVDITDVITRGIVVGGGINSIYEIIMRFNIVGLGRFSISLIGEASRRIKVNGEIIKKEQYIQRKTIIESYIQDLKELYNYYNDESLYSYLDDLVKYDYVSAINKSSELSQKRGGKSLKNMDDINSFFERKKQ